MIYGYSDYLEGFKKLGYYPGQLVYLPVEEGSSLQQRIGRLLAITGSYSSLDSEGEVEADYAAIVLPILELDAENTWYMIFDAAAKVLNPLSIDDVPRECASLLPRSLLGFGKLEIEGDTPSFVPMWTPQE